VFNPKSQNFRQQKARPSLILAEKKGRLVLPTPEGFGIGHSRNFYFSHMLNCLYDCRYCFLQGMYPSANYVLFVNYEDFMQAIDQQIIQQPEQSLVFFSGYDGDSLAFESVSEFVKTFVPFFAKRPQATLELRSKSDNISALLEQPPQSNIVLAFSLTPQAISSEHEHGVPPLKKRLQAMQTVAQLGWPIGLRFDPLIYHNDFKALYLELIQQVFSAISPDQVHSVSIGSMRFPSAVYQKLTKLYPKDKLLAQPLVKRGQTFGYHQDIEQQLVGFVRETLKNTLSDQVLFSCSPWN